jgi:hypothetical protein
VFSLDPENNILSEKQTVIDRKEQGVFKYNIKKLIVADPHATPRKIPGIIKSVTKPCLPSFIVGETTNDLINHSLRPKPNHLSIQEGQNFEKASNIWIRLAGDAPRGMPRSPFGTVDRRRFGSLSHQKTT